MMDVACLVGGRFRVIRKPLSRLSDLPQFRKRLHLDVFDEPQKAVATGQSQLFGWRLVSRVWDH